MKNTSWKVTIEFSFHQFITLCISISAASQCTPDYPFSLTNATKCCSDYIRSSHPICQAKPYSDKAKQILFEDPPECCNGNIIDCPKEPHTSGKCRDKIELTSAACTTEYRFSFDHGRKCCFKDVKDVSPGPGCQDLDNQELTFWDHGDCCQDSIECPKENAICENNESGKLFSTLIDSVIPFHFLYPDQVGAIVAKLGFFTFSL